MRRILWLALFISAKSVFAVTKPQEEFVGPPNCPLDYYGDRATTRCYGFPRKDPKNPKNPKDLEDPKEGKTWVEAEKACRDQHGLLAIFEPTPEGAKVLKYLRSQAIKHNIHGAWIAANDGPSKNAFAWLDGSPLQQSGHLKYYAKYPEPHEGPSCVWLSFDAKENDVLIRNEKCNKEKKQYICHMPLYIPDDEDATTKKLHSVTPTPSKKPNKKPEPKGKSASVNEIRRKMPENLPGSSAILSVSADKLIIERRNKIKEMFGSFILTEEEMEKILPPEFLILNFSETIFFAAKTQLTEIVGDFFQMKRKSNTTEIAKYMTSHMLEEGRSIRCIYGVNQLQRQVECLPENGIIDSCAKTITMDGTIARECGLPGLRQAGCHNTLRGVACFCEKDLCNISQKNFPLQKSLFLFLIFLNLLL